MAADQGFAFAIISLASIYSNGEGIEVDMKEASKSHKIAADHGHCPSIFAYGKNAS